MKKLHFEIVINAPREKVYKTMLDDATYRDWTKTFHDGSYYSGSWDKGSRIQFLSPEGEGMFATIVENRPHEFISIKILGMIKNGVEEVDTDEAKNWTPTYENYTFADAVNGTLLSIDTDLSDNDIYVEMFSAMWPKALERLKELAEK